MARYKFGASYDELPEGDSSADRVTLTVTDHEEDDEVVYALTAGEARQLVREAIRALALTKVKRAPRQREADWESAVETVVEAFMGMINLVMPRPSRRVVRRRVVVQGDQ